jgi:hypothetical protein
VVRRCVSFSLLNRNRRLSSELLDSDSDPLSLSFQCQIFDLIEVLTSKLRTTLARRAKCVREGGTSSHRQSMAKFGCSQTDTPLSHVIHHSSCLTRFRYRRMAWGSMDRQKTTVWPVLYCMDMDARSAAHCSRKTKEKDSLF